MWWFVSCLMFWPIIKILVGFEDQARPAGRTGSCRWRAAFAKVGLIWWLCCCCHWWWWWWWLTIISGLSLGTTWGEATSRPLDPAILLPQAINPELSIWSIILDTTSLIIIGDDYKNIIKKVCQFNHRHHHHPLQHFDHGQHHPSTLLSPVSLVFGWSSQKSKYQYKDHLVGYLLIYTVLQSRTSTSWQILHMIVGFI